MGLTGKVALVTGGGTGIGKGVALALAREGARVVIMGRRIQPLKETARLIETLGGEAAAIAGDVSSFEDVARVIDHTSNQWQRLDLLVNNAGVYAKENGLLGTSLALIHELISTNLLGVILTTQAAVPLMLRNGGGCVINIASYAAIGSAPGQPVYGASKAGVIHLTQSLARTLGPTIRVNAISPDWTFTKTADEAKTEEEEQRLADGGSCYALGRIAFPEDIASACLWLASPEASYISGSNLLLHGGGAVFRRK